MSTSEGKRPEQIEGLPYALPPEYEGDILQLQQAVGAATDEQLALWAAGAARELKLVGLDLYHRACADRLDLLIKIEQRNRAAARSSLQRSRE